MVAANDQLVAAVKGQGLLLQVSPYPVFILQDLRATCLSRGRMGHIHMGVALIFSRHLGDDWEWERLVSAPSSPTCTTGCLRLTS